MPWRETPFLKCAKPLKDRERLRVAANRGSASGEPSPCPVRVRDAQSLGASGQDTPDYGAVLSSSEPSGTPRTFVSFTKCAGKKYRHVLAVWLTFNRVFPQANPPRVVAAPRQLEERPKRPRALFDGSLDPDQFAPARARHVFMTPSARNCSPIALPCFATSEGVHRGSIASKTHAQ